MDKRAENFDGARKEVITFYFLFSKLHLSNFSCFFFLTLLLLLLFFFLYQHMKIVEEKQKEVDNLDLKLQVLPSKASELRRKRGELVASLANLEMSIRKKEEVSSIKRCVTTVVFCLFFNCLLAKVSFSLIISLFLFFI